MAGVTARLSSQAPISLTFPLSYTPSVVAALPDNPPWPNQTYPIKMRFFLIQRMSLDRADRTGSSERVLAPISCGCRER